jgi:hypothetical protein
LSGTLFLRLQIGYPTGGLSATWIAQL